MHVIDAYKQAVRIANEFTFANFQIYGPYEIGSAAHEFWLKCFDENFKSLTEGEFK